MKFRISKKDALGFISNKELELPKYGSQIINLANQNAQGTRPKVVGQMSELIEEFGAGSIEEWEEWYLERNPEAVDNATAKITKMVENLRHAITLIDEDHIRAWVEDLVLYKTYIGLRCQEAILKRIAQDKGLEYRRSTPAEEAQGIDGYIGDTAVSIKADTYKSKDGLSENISVAMVYYKKTKAGFTVEYDF